MGTRVTGVLATVPWRRLACVRTLMSLACQSRPLDALLLVRDGSQEPFGALAEAASGATLDLEHLKPHGAFSRLTLGWQFAEAHDATHVAVFDDDCVYPPDYLECMLHAQAKERGPVALGGTDESWTYQPYWHSWERESIRLVEPNVAVSLWPILPDVPALVMRDPMGRDLSEKQGDLAVAYALWAHGERGIVLPHHGWIVVPDASCMDERSLWKARGGEPYVWSVRRELYERTGYPASDNPPKGSTLGYGMK